MARKRLTSDETTRQARQHLEALDAAGVQFLPRTGPASAGPAAEAAPIGSLFEEPAPDAPPAPASPDDRRRELAVLAERVSTCPRCPELAATRTQTVFGVGPVDPVLCFIGEAPGGDEDRTGEPFVGAAGQLLNRIIAACGLKREEVYICNIIKCRPPGNRQPKTSECNNCREYLEKQIDLVRPPFLCALGATAAQQLLGVKMSIGKLRGSFHDFRGIPVVCTYHPASLLPSRSPENKKYVWEDLKMLLRRMGRPIPTGGQAQS